MSSSSSSEAMKMRGKSTIITIYHHHHHYSCYRIILLTLQFLGGSYSNSSIVLALAVLAVAVAVLVKAVIRKGWESTNSNNGCSYYCMFRTANTLLHSVRLGFVLQRNHYCGNTWRPAVVTTRTAAPSNIVRGVDRYRFWLLIIGCMCQSQGKTATLWHLWWSRLLRSRTPQ